MAGTAIDAGIAPKQLLVGCQIFQKAPKILKYLPKPNLGVEKDLLFIVMWH